MFAGERAPTRRRVERYVDMVGLSTPPTASPPNSPAACASASPWRARSRMDPEVLLLDEPLSALDALTRAKLQTEIDAIWSRDKKTVVLVTNDVDEAILLADRIIPLKPGPGATFGPEFVVPFARPRDRSEMNDNPAFKQLRAGRSPVSDGRRRPARCGCVDRPARACRTSCRSPSIPAPPRAYREAAASPVDDRYLEFSTSRRSTRRRRDRSPWSTISTSRCARASSSR